MLKEMMYHYSQRGVSHCQRGILNQDAVYALNYNGVEALAVADGVGSCANSDVGSKFVTEFITLYACQHFEELARMSNGELQNLIIKQFEISNPIVDINNALSTLLLVAKKGSKVLFLQIGDGKIILVAKGNSSQVFPDDGLPMNQSYTWHSIPDCFCKMVLDAKCFNMDFVLLCTDGVYKPDKSPVEFNGGLSYLNLSYTMELYQINGHLDYQNFIYNIVTATNGKYGDVDDKTAALMVLRYS